MGLLDSFLNDPLGSVTGGIGGGNLAGAVKPDYSTSSIANRSPVNVAPIGVNLGAILQPYEQGSPQNGGAGYDFINRYVGSGRTLTASDVGKPSLMPYVLMAGAGLLLLLFALR